MGYGDLSHDLRLFITVRLSTHKKSWSLSPSLGESITLNMVAGLASWLQTELSENRVTQQRPEGASYATISGNTTHWHLPPRPVAAVKVGGGFSWCSAGNWMLKVHCSCYLQILTLGRSLGLTWKPPRGPGSQASINSYRDKLHPRSLATEHLPAHHEEPSCVLLDSLTR